MPKEDFLSVLDHSLRFVHLHGWVDQTRDEILAVWKFFLEFPERREEFQQTVLNRLERAVATEEKLLCLIFFRYLDVPATEIAALFLRFLGEKLGKRDVGTIQRYFFDTRSPIPEEFSREITDRVFLTNERAIHRVMQIDAFDSEFDAEDNVLFLVQLLCRNDLYEQNRAMVYLLLSRIESPLPQEIELRVRKAMNELRELIAAIEAGREMTPLPVSEEPSAQEALWKDGESAAPSGARASREPAAPKGLAASLEAYATRSAAPETRVVRPLPQPRSALPGVLGLAATSPTNGQQERKVAVPTAVAMGSLFTTTPAPLAPPETGPAAPAPLEKRVEALAKAEPEVPQDVAGSFRGSGGSRQQFRINFGRQSEELDGVLKLLGPHQPSAPEVVPAEPAPEIVHSRQRRRFWPWLVGAGVVALVAMIVILAAQRGSPTPLALPPSAPSPVTPLETTASPSEKRAFVIVIRGEQVVLIPAAGDKLWDLFVGMREGLVSFSGDASLRALAWPEFIAAIQTLNSGLNPDLILTGREVRLR